MKKIHKYFTSPRGIEYHIWVQDDKIWRLWMWSNRESGWSWVGDYATYEVAFDFMKSIDPSQGWIPD